ncbi:MAG: PadR family transcriptional regulator [Anaerolineales bacterium]
MSNAQRSKGSSRSRRPRRASALQPEYLLLGMLLERPSHGYELHQRIAENLPGLWSISLSQTYNLLKRMENSADIKADPAPGGRSQTRYIFRVTDSGRSRFLHWLLQPTPASVRAIRLVFLTRLHFTLHFQADRVLDLFETQRRQLDLSLRRLKRSSIPEDGAIASRMAADLRLRELKLVRAWLDDCQRSLEELNPPDGVEVNPNG